MTEQPKRRVAMVICAPLKGIKPLINKTIKGVEKHKGQGGFKCQLYVVVAECPRDRAEDVKAELGTLTARFWSDKRMILTPAELDSLSGKSVRKQSRLLAEYLAFTLIKRLIRPPASTFDVGLIWNENWPVWTAAGSAASAALQGVFWWEPPASPWLRLLPDLRKSEASRAPDTFHEDSEDPIVGKCEAIERVREQIRLFAGYPDPVLIVGETGKGKELCARRLHELSGRKGRLASINGALLDPRLAASTLFGHKKGAFTGAEADRRGRILEAGEEGTFFLDELSSVPVAVQSKLLRTLQDAEDGIIHIEPVGSEGPPESARIRFISALQRDPLVTGELRPDLYYRVAGLTLELPPLRERGDDVLLLTERFLKKMTERRGDAPHKLDRNVEQKFREYPWPGNVRELRVTVRQAWIQASSRGASTVAMKDLPGRFRAAQDTAFETSGTLRKRLARYVIAAADFALASNPDNKTAAAKSLGFRTGQELERFRDSHRKHLNFEDQT